METFWTNKEEKGISSGHIQKVIFVILVMLSLMNTQTGCWLSLFFDDMSIVSWIQFALKVFGCSFYMLFAAFKVVEHVHWNRIVMVIGTFFGFLGDILLGVPQQRKIKDDDFLFMAGVVSFGIGHIFYIVHFVFLFKFRKAKDFLKLLLILIPLVLFSSIYFPLVFPDLHTVLLKCGATLYGVLLLGMAGCSLVPEFSIWRVLGGLMFASSDLLLSIGRFVVPNYEYVWETIIDSILMILYIFAQFFLLLSLDTVRKKKVVIEDKAEDEKEEEERKEKEPLISKEKEKE